MPKKTTKPKNPSDPILLARSVVEAAVGQPLMQKEPVNKKPSEVLRALKGKLDGKESKTLLSVLVDMAERLESDSKR